MAPGGLGEFALHSPAIMTSTAALPAAGAAYPLVGCTVAPDSALSKFELAERAYLTTKFPNARNLIHRFT